MIILDRYILKNFFKFFFLTLLAFTLIYLIVDFFGRIRMFLSNDATAIQIASYFLYSIPQTISHTIPVSMLLGSLLSFSTLSKNSEIIAMKSSGISIYRISIPILYAALLITVCSFFFNEFVTPSGNEKAKYIKEVEVKKQQAGVFKQDQIWHRSKNAIYNYVFFDPATNTLRGITINYFDSQFRLSARIDAQSAHWTHDHWVFQDLLITTFDRDSFPVLERHTSRVVELPEQPDDLKAIQKSPDEMGFVELRQYIHKLMAEGFDADRFLADMHGKIALCHGEHHSGFCRHIVFLKI